MLVYCNWQVLTLIRLLLVTQYVILTPFIQKNTHLHIHLIGGFQIQRKVKLSQKSVKLIQAIHVGVLELADVNPHPAAIT